MLAAYLNLLYYTCKMHLLSHSFLPFTRVAHQAYRNRLDVSCTLGSTRPSFVIESASNSARMLTTISFPSAIYTLFAITVSASTTP